ncbi:MAG: DUF3293 domain-containing protein [Elioraea sp.]|nr:DUF3293 domain-containing protein [Elioraea sp.]
MSLSPQALAEAYREAWYRVDLPEGAEEIRVGLPVPPRLSAWIAARRKHGAALVTACNPHGRRASDADNAAAQARLRALIAARGWPALPGEGGSDRGDWPAEPSFLVALDSRAQAERLGRAFRQNAILWLPRRGRTELVWLAGPQAGCQ